ncbi:helix-turn-helix domain-containing protein [Enterococcus hirae]|nr:helix-turn-helix domain-containing protein [Enterococcus hirae]
MQPQETFTIKELSELFNISRQAISKHIQKLDSSMVAKNERGYKVVLRSGVLQLARNLDNQRLLDKLHEHEQSNDKNAYISSKNMIANELLEQLREENKFLHEQLQEKDEQIKQMQKLLDQQQQLTLQANQQIEKLQEQLKLTYTEESPENDSTTLSEATETIEKQIDNEKKWWQLWK